MALPYYTHASGRPNDQTRALAAIVRDELDLIAASFDLLPLPSALVSGLQGYAVDTGTADAYMITTSPLLIAYADGLTLRIKATNANTGPSTLNVNALGIRPIVRPDGTNLVANDIWPGQIVQVSYNATTSQFQLALTPLAAVYQALGYASAAASSAGAAASSAGAAATSDGNAASSATLAGQWATSLSPVDGMYFGARKYAIDAGNSASAAATSEGNAATSASQAAASAALATQTFNGTSTTSLTVSAGAKNLTTQTGKAWVVGQRIAIARTSDPTIVMFGGITGYNSGTGALAVLVDKFSGSGAFTDWTLGLSGANGTPSTLTTVLMSGNLTASDGNYYLMSGAFTLTMPDPLPAAGVTIGFGMSRSATGGIVNFGTVNVKGRPAGSMTMLGQNDSAIVQSSGNPTDGWREV